MTIPRPTTSWFRPFATSLWIGRGLESLWLLTVVLVPIAFLDRDYVVSEAIISYVEVPKVALLRTLVGLMAILWFIEWGIGSRLSLSSLIKAEGRSLRPIMWIGRLGRWLKGRPTRWLMVAGWFFLATTLLSTILSGSFNSSMWGEVPGQDGYPAYTVAVYVVLFGVIATHLRATAQLWRLLGAIAVMGTMVAGYGIFQHYGHDFLGLAEITGGGSRAATSFMGNKIFSAAVMLMTIPVTLLAGTMSLRELSTASGAITKWPRSWMLTVGIAGLWATALAVQLLGITFTFARGPWIGSIAALLMFLVLTLAFAGWRTFSRAAVLLALALALILAVLLWQGSFSTLGSSPGLGVLAALLGFGWCVAVLSPRRRLSQVALGLGLAAALVFTVVLSMIWFRGGGADSAPTAGLPVASGDSTASQVAERFGSVKREVLSGFGGRGTHWKVSWELIKDRPWFEFDTLSLPWLRPLIGYGPDLFRYTYLLRSPPEGESGDFLPLEPDHAHNFFIHQTVEQGILGLLSSLGIFVTVFVVGGYQLLRQSKSISTPHKLILVGLLAVMAGRFLEMMVGVARVSDLTLLWVLLGVFAALSVVMQSEGEQVVEGHALLASRSRRRRRRGTSASPRASNYDWQLFWRLAIVAWLIGGIGVLTWVKSISYVRAAVEEAEGLKHFRQGNLQSTLESLDRATSLAPDVSHYYTNLSNVYLTYQINKNVVPELGCSSQDDLPYDVCLAVRGFQSNLEGVKQQPFYYRSRLALANSAYNLPQLRDQTVQFYEQSLALVPTSWPIRNELAETYISAGRPKDALQTLRESLDITKDRPASKGAYFLLGIAYRDLGDPGNSVLSMERSLQLGLSEDPARRAHRVLAEYHLSSGRFEQALASLDQLVSTEPDDAKSHASRGIVYSELGEYNRAVQDFEEAVRLDPGQEVDFARLGKSYFELDRFSQAIPALDRAIDGDPVDSKSLAYRGKAYDGLGQSDLAFKDLDKAILISPQDAEARYLRGLVNFDQGQHEQAVRDLDEAIRLDPTGAKQYIARGHARSGLGRLPEAKADYAMAIDLSSRADQPKPDQPLEDLEAEVRLNPQDPQAYIARGLALYRLGRYERSIQDFDEAIKLNSQDADQLISRGLAYHALGLYERAIEDYDKAIDLMRGHFYLGLPHYFEYFFSRGLAYFNLGQYERTIPDMKSAMNFEHPGLAEAFVIRGISYRQLGRAENAMSDLASHQRSIQDLHQAIMLYPEKPKVYYTRGLAYFHLGQYLLATAYFDEALRLTPQDPLAYLERGKAYGALADYRQALQDLDRAVSLSPQGSEAYFNRGLISFRAGLYQEAIADLSQAIQLNPDYYGTHHNRALAYVSLGMDAEAQRDIEMAIKAAGY